MKRCTTCKQEKPLEDFNLDNSSKNGYRYHCRVCSKAYSVRYRRERWDKFRDSQLRAQYGISLAERNALAAKQNNRCAICLLEKPLEVDHNHETGQVRGLLCNPCNTALGLFKENGNSLGAAIIYLLSYPNARELRNLERLAKGEIEISNVHN